MEARTFQFKPRHRGVAFISMGVGGSLAAIAAILGFLAVPFTSGVIGVVLGAGYLLSPAWRLGVTVDDKHLTVGTPSKQRFQLAWEEIVAVIASPTTHTCFVDGGKPELSLIVPGDGAAAPYDIADKVALYEAILAKVPAERVTTVETLEAYRAAQAKKTS